MKRLVERRIEVQIPPPQLLIDDGPQFVHVQAVRNNSPAEDAGLQADDTIVSIGGDSASRDTWQATLNRYRPGDRVPLIVKRDRQTIQTKLVLAAPESFAYRIEEKKDATAEEKQLRAAWLKGI